MSKAQRILASLLVLNAFLMAGVLWVHVADRPILARTAVAQQRNLPNAGAQRDRMVAILNQINTSVAQTNAMLQRGQARVQVVDAKAATKTPPTRSR